MSEYIHIHLATMAPQFMDVRTTLPIRGLSAGGAATTSMSSQQISLPRLKVDQPKVIVIQRMGVSNLAGYKTVVRSLVEKGWVVVTELDDHPDLLNAVHSRPPSEAVWHTVRLAHAVQTSTPELADVFRSYNPKVASFPNAAFRLAPPPSDRRQKDLLRVFFGALNRERFSSRIGAALSELAARRSDIRFVVVHDRAFFDGLGSANKEFHSALPYDKYLSLMEGCDIALMPLQGAPGEAFKSDVKYVEASSLGLATLASPVVYGRTILDGVNGLIVPDVEGWATALEALATDRSRLQRLAAAAYGYVARSRLFNAQVQDRLDWYRHLWDEREALTRSLSARFKAA